MLEKERKDAYYRVRPMYEMNDQKPEKMGKPEELLRAEKLIDDAKVKEAHELLDSVSVELIIVKIVLEPYLIWKMCVGLVIIQLTIQSLHNHIRKNQNASKFRKKQKTNK